MGRLADYFADILENEFDSEIDMDILNAVRELLLHLLFFFFDYNNSETAHLTHINSFRAPLYGSSEI